MLTADHDEWVLQSIQHWESRWPIMTLRVAVATLERTSAVLAKTVSTQCATVSRDIGRSQRLSLAALRRRWQSGFKAL
jgi:hypothetical protein